MGLTNTELGIVADLMLDSDAKNGAQRMFRSMDEVAKVVYQWNKLTADALIVQGRKEEAMLRLEKAEEAKVIYLLAYGRNIEEDLK